MLEKIHLSSQCLHRDQMVLSVRILRKVLYTASQLLNKKIKHCLVMFRLWSF